MNYLMRGTSSVQVGESRSREETVYVDDMYKLFIYNGSGTIKFTGYVPENFNFGLQSTWSSPFEGKSLADAPQGQVRQGMRDVLGSLDKVLKFSGLSSMHKVTTARVWDSPAYLSLELPIFLVAYSSTEKEVILPMLNMLCMTAPDDVGGVLVPPGPVPSKEFMNAMVSAANDVGEAVGLGSNSINANFESSEAFTVKLGNFFTMSPAIITSVSGAGDASFEDGTGKPISADFMLTVESYFAVTRQDLYEWFGVPPQSQQQRALNVLNRAV